MSPGNKKKSVKESPQLVLIRKTKFNSPITDEKGIQESKIRRF